MIWLTVVGRRSSSSISENDAEELFAVSGKSFSLNVRHQDSALISNQSQIKESGLGSKYYGYIYHADILSISGPLHVMEVIHGL